jgi:hypothetical protein
MLIYSSRHTIFILLLCINLDKVLVFSWITKLVMHNEMMKMVLLTNLIGAYHSIPLPALLVKAKSHLFRTGMTWLRCCVSLRITQCAFSKSPPKPKPLFHMLRFSQNLSFLGNTRHSL